MLGAALALAAVATAVAPSLGSQLGDLRTQAEDGVREATDQLAKPPFNLSERELRDRVDQGLKTLRKNSGPLARGLSSGAVLLGEVLTGLIVAVLLTFFLLKDGAAMWAWVLRLVRKRSRADADEVGNRVYTALAGYVRGIAMVGFVDAILIAIALVIIGVPLVVPLAVITFFAAFVPLIGAFIAGLLAVLIALVSGGLLDAALVLGAIILVQQVEGHVLYPLLMSRAVHLHPAVIVVSLGAGGILAGIIGVFLAVPVAGVVSVILDYTQNRPAPETPLSESPAIDYPSSTLTHPLYPRRSIPPPLPLSRLHSPARSRSSASVSSVSRLVRPRRRPEPRAPTRLLTPASCRSRELAMTVPGRDDLGS